MSPSARLLWSKLPIGKWMRRDAEELDNLPNYQRAITDLSNDGLIEFEFRDVDENGLKMPVERQFIRRKPIAEIVQHYADVLSPRSKKYNKRIFTKLQIKCKIKR